MKVRVCADAVLRPTEHGVWTFSNPRTRTHVAVDSQAAATVMDLGAGAEEGVWIDALRDAHGSDRTEFAHKVGLVVDPTGFRTVGTEELRGATLFQALRSGWILHNIEGRDYAEYLRPRLSAFDRAHLGTFHQHIGYYELFVLRSKNAWRWWHDQKFTPDGLALKPGLYRAVQGYFFDSYFRDQALTGKRVLDFACGNGYYSAAFARLGANVVGIDLSPELIAIGRQNFGLRVSFYQPERPEDALALLRTFPSGSFDVVYVSDALLFFFRDRATGEAQIKALDVLLREFFRLLSPEGLLYLMEPNGAFWLSSWYGAPELPMAVITEYRTPLYQVSPTIEQVIGAVARVGFVVQSFVHPRIDPTANDLPPKEFAYGQEFPLWDFYALRKLM